MRIKLLEHLLCWEDDIRYEVNLRKQVLSVNIVGWVKKEVVYGETIPFSFCYSARLYLQNTKTINLLFSGFSIIL